MLYIHKCVCECIYVHRVNLDLLESRVRMENQASLDLLGSGAFLVVLDLQDLRYV